MDGYSARMIWKALTGLAGRARASGRSIIIAVARQIGLSDLRVDVLDDIDGPAGRDSVVTLGPTDSVIPAVECACGSNVLDPVVSDVLRIFRF